MTAPRLLTSALLCCALLCIVPATSAAQGDGEAIVGLERSTPLDEYQNEIRLTNLARTDTRQVAAMTTGLGGQTYLGPSIAEGRVAFFRACQGDPAGCRTSNSGAIRYRISNGDYTHVGADEAWTGWAWSGAAGYHVPSAFACGGGDPAVVTPACAVVRRTGLQWTPISASRVR